MLKRKIRNFLIVFGLLSIFIALFLIIYKYYNNYNIDKLEEEKIELFFEEQKEKLLNEDLKQITEEAFIVNETPNYIAVIEIPKISLKKGLYDINSKLNNINKNIEILKESTMPIMDSSNLILAAHNGSSSISYFKNIDKLEKNDVIYIYYNNMVYSYKVIEKYEIEKTGKTTIKRNTNKKVLTLITCKNKTDKQIVIISELFNEKEYL